MAVFKWKQQVNPLPELSGRMECLVSVNKAPKALWVLETLDVARTTEELSKSFLILLT